MEKQGRRWLRWVVVTLAICGAAIWWFVRADDGRDANLVTFEHAVVQRGEIVVKINATGTLSPRVLVAVGSQVSGRIAELHADYNDPVKKGAVLARIDPRIFANELARAQANLSAARATHKRASADLRYLRRHAGRLKPLVGSGAVAAVDVDKAVHDARLAEIAVESASAAIEVAKAAVALAGTNLALTTIVAPTDGIVISRDVDVGQTVAASLSAPQLFTVAGDLRTMEVHTHVAESDVGRLRAGQAVEFTVDAFSARSFKGVVKSVRFAPQIVQNVVTYDAVVAVDNADLALWPGMTADVAFVVDRRANVLVIPSVAARVNIPGMTTTAALKGASRPQSRGRAEGASKPRRPGSASQKPARGRRRVVYRLDGSGQPASVSIATGATDGSFIEVKEGLEVGDKIVTKVVGAGGKKGGKGKPRYGRIL